MGTIRKLLVANRGEIACRIFSTAREMGITTVAVYSDADAQALHVRLADEAFALGGSKPSESYLAIDKILEAARVTGADAIHPGYGFLSENAEFARRCAEVGIIFVGPSYHAIEKLGGKSEAKEIMRRAGVPVVPGYHGDDQNLARFEYEAEEIGYPVLLKASAGGGGRGMRIVHNRAELASAFEAAKREALSGFGNDKLLLEKYFPYAKHIEFQVLGDEHGNYVHLGERECSLQRRHQKVIEEAPSPSLTDELRREMGEAAIAAARAVNYTNAGTVEFLLDDKRNYYFLEVNTRLQVEHPVTEMITMLDLVRLQIQIAEGQPLPAYVLQLEPTTMHAIECRVCAEDPANNFFPAAGEILRWREPELENVRTDSGVETGSRVSIFYDSLLAKVIVVDENRAQAIRLMRKALDELVTLGITTNVQFLKSLLQHPAFVDGSFDTRLIEREFNSFSFAPDEQTIHETLIAARVYEWMQYKKDLPHAPSLSGWRNIPYKMSSTTYEINGTRYELHYSLRGENTMLFSLADKEYNVTVFNTDDDFFTLAINNLRRHFCAAGQGENIFVHHPQYGALHIVSIPRFAEVVAEKSAGRYISPMPGEVLRILVKPGDRVKAGQALLIMNSMKMDMTLEAQTDGEVTEIFVTEKGFVHANTELLKIKQI
ncbi:MAG: acetyl-CoA carboxylase biotin carboxylase subunit [Chitinophagales bacterium]|nr:acetyl-CoA carboxylase biotin carboxylase subunit [Chitinophagales bacterium]MDW8419564.1 acetyl-CoA carboxylase biotin carboxylase subunit [Chitinophagales bacterium]